MRDPIDFGDYNDKLSKSGREVLALAIEESRRRDQNYLAAEHLFLALLKSRTKTFRRNGARSAPDSRRHHQRYQPASGFK